MDDCGCENCGSTTLVVDYERGSYCCEECGCVARDPIQVAVGSYKTSHDIFGVRVAGAPRDEPVLAGARVTTVAAERMANERRKCSPPYRRETYWAERISQCRMLEPAIDEGDLRLILAQYDEFTNKYLTNPNAVWADAEWKRNDRGALVCNRIIDKEDCRQLLWAIDERRARVEGAKPVFVKKYLVSAFVS